MLKDNIDNISISDNKYKKILHKIKRYNNNDENIYKINYINNYIRTLFISKNLSLKLPIPTLSFVNIQNVEKDEWSFDFNNKLRLDEIKILKKNNITNYVPFIFKNKTHYIFNKKQPANKIISIIKDNVK